MKYALALSVSLALILSGCDRGVNKAQRLELDRLERLAEAQRKVDILVAQAHACDKNGGIVDIKDDYCYKGRCQGKIVKCADGMQRNFPE